MNLNQSLIFVLLTVTIQGCASAPRVLKVRSEPAEAEVCIKGKAGSRDFKNSKTCFGSTPFEAESVTVTDDAGKKRLIRFSDLDQDKEQFYLVVSRPGYAPQSVTVPAWEHFLTLRQEQPKEPAAPAMAPIPSASSKGSAKISSDPVGALVYVNDFLKGNTPYVIEAEAGQTLRLKIEQAGYRAMERSITIESGKAMEINLPMEKDASSSIVVKQAAASPAAQQ